MRWRDAIHSMNVRSQLALGTDAQRYEALLRISQALFTCKGAEDLPRILADRLRELIPLDYLEVVIFKENSNEVEWHLIGEGRTAYGEVPVEDTSTWHVHHTQEPVYIADWTVDAKFSGFGQLVAQSGLQLGSLVRVPLTTAYRRLGVLSIASRNCDAYLSEDVTFLQSLGREVACAIDNALNLRKSEAARLELERQNARLKLLLDLTSKITSNLDLRELLRSISASVRPVMHCDSVGILLPDGSEVGKFRIYALDFPQGKGILHEELLISPGNKSSARAFETLKAIIVNQTGPADFSPEAYEITVGEGLMAECFIPLVNRGQALGVLSLARTKHDSFSLDDVAFLSQVSGQIAIAVANAQAYGEISELKNKLAQEKLYLEEEIRSEMNFGQIIGNSPALKHVQELVETVAPNDSTTLLLGETGTGKELIARAIHDLSRRKDRTFVKLNCAAIPTGLLESELFGHERGAFTGAITQKMGRLELADQGTLFLDEVGDIPIEIQPKLLRALQEREFERLGSTQTRKVNVRLVAATSRDLEKMIAAREFRSDLYYRLNVFPIRIPPLRERREDIPLLVRYFVQKFSRQMRKNVEAIPAAAMKALTAWDWPGNIRELENLIERSVILTRSKTLEVPLDGLRRSEIDEPASHRPLRGGQDIARIVRETLSELTNGALRGAAKEHDENQRQEIVRFLRETKGRVGGADGAAARMGINRTTLLSRMKKYGIHSKQFA